MKYLSRNILLHLYDIYRKNPTRDPEISYGELFSQTKGSLGHSSDFVESLFEPEFQDALTELDRLGYLRERRLSRVIYYRLTSKGRSDASGLLETTRRDRDRTGQFSSQTGTDYSSPVPTDDFWKWLLLGLAAVGVVIALMAKGLINVPCFVCGGKVCSDKKVLLSASVVLRQAPGFSAAPCNSDRAAPNPNPYPTPYPEPRQIAGGPRYVEGACWWKMELSAQDKRPCEGWVPESSLSVNSGR